MDGLDVAVLQRAEAFCRLVASDGSDSMTVDLVADPVPLAESPVEIDIGGTRVCLAGRNQLYESNPPSAACPRCRTDAECSGATAVCDAANGACVGCTSAANCQDPGRPACDLASHVCVACTGDGDCSTAALPACDVASHRCVACGQDSQCASGRCESNHTSCVPETACTPGSCGDASDGCAGTLPCGACAIGTCESNLCNTENQPCPAGSTGCGPGSRCVFDATTRVNRCASLGSKGRRCMSDGSCNTEIGHRYYRCDSTDTCRTICLTTTDCGSGEACIPWSGTISTTNPGFCR